MNVCSWAQHINAVDEINEITLTRPERCHVVVDRSHVISWGLGYCLTFVFYFFIIFLAGPHAKFTPPAVATVHHDHDDDVIVHGFSLSRLSIRLPTRSCLWTVNVVVHCFTCIRIQHIIMYIITIPRFATPRRQYDIHT